MLFRLFLGFLLLATIRLAAGEPEWHARSGLPTVAARARAGGELRVAYLGGSITAAEGWRSLVTAYLHQRWPKLKIEETNAGLPGTGSDLGACRVGMDVLTRRPDLVFVEFAVNDATTPPEKIERTMEGIVRQVWRANPETDICFVYTVSTPGWPDIAAGKLNASAQAMERVAQHYGIPSIVFGFEVARRVAAGELVFKGTAEDGAKAFTLDGVHPTPGGHQVYAGVVQRAWPELIQAGQKRGGYDAHASRGEGPPPTTSRVLSTPMHADNWDRAEQRALTAEMRRGDWQQVPLDDPNLRGATKRLLPPTWRTATPGDSLEFEFTGTRLGLLGIASPDNGGFTVQIDDGEPVPGTFFDAYVSPTFCRQRSWFHPETLAPGKHRVRVTLSAEPIDKAAVMEKAGKTLAPAEAFTPQRLTVSALLLIDLSPQQE